MASRSRRIPVIALLAGALVALAIPAQAAFEPQWGECATRATSLTTTEPELGSGGKANFTITWDAEFVNAPEGCDAENLDELDERFGWIVQWSNDWRPQQWELVVVDWSERRVKFSGMLPGRTYEVRVMGFELGEPDELQSRVEQSVPRNPEQEGYVTVPARPGKPGDREQGWAVSIGDSFISGEGGRWAGNTSNDLANTNDTGFTAYWDTWTDELWDTCHRSKSALIHIGTLRSMNFACSGAITRSQILDGYWKPGPLPQTPAEFPPRQSQSDMLSEFARDNEVKLVVQSIGGNNFFFSKIVTQCVKAFLLLPFTNCETWDDARGWLTPEHQATVQAEVSLAIKEVIKAMRDAGARDGSWTFIQNLYPKPIPMAEDFRYPNEGFTRHSDGGCGFSNAAANWAVSQVTPVVNATVRRAVDAVRNDPAYANIPIYIMDTQEALTGHELCNEDVFRLNTSDRYDRKGVKRWTDKDAALSSEWVKDIDIIQQEGTELDEGFHPNYWGQLALRNCLRQVWNNGYVWGDAKCLPGPGKVTKRGEPKMVVDVESPL